MEIYAVFYTLSKSVTNTIFKRRIQNTGHRRQNDGNQVIRGSGKQGFNIEY
jgi:hypothetical protein